MINPLLEFFDQFKTELIEDFRKVIKEELALIQAQQEEKLLSTSEACKLFSPKITRPTLDKLVKTGKLKKQHLGSRVYFNRSELLSVVKTFKRYAA